ncbi:Hemagglutinin/proteinase precursor [Legionella massiliensis]|uniref:Neutral metalloproteinase n=1 Tax=Legionella massiliensis TaxID=1034943 RepID=A0A078KYR0_9GAMM|nr:M4 family metallopeptidase [Legionella massiliensis]CDZ78207.1 Hemagglutinin/proteinase precursor [Legionella massiliensis]CEE13945.1 Hemagglutinin/proteinase precursor [Legionella massiliensis]
MLKQLVTLSLFTPTLILAATPIELYQAPLSSLNKFNLIDRTQNSPALRALATPENNVLQSLNQTKVGNNTVVRYQQLYKGIPVVGSQVTVVKNNNPGLKAQANSQVNGHLLDEIKIDIKPAISKQSAIDLARKAYFSLHPQAATTAELSQLQIRPNDNGELILSYLVSFKTTKSDEKPVWPFFVIDAHTGALLKQWNNVKNYMDTGPGGNEKVHEYWYGKDGLPALNVHQNGPYCLMESKEVRLVNLNSKWDWNNSLLAPFKYPCNNNTEESINGAYSPTNDAYYFGHVIVDMYRKWYGVNVLQYPTGAPMQLIMRVHFGQYYDNAFWDGEAMSFGDGEELYPLVSLDIAGHEVTHGFTEQHSNLEYHDQQGALNESLSDMAGQAVRAYLLETSPALYNKAHLVPNEITWGVGETVVRDQFGTAIRFMDQPSQDNESADCLDKNLAKRSGATCKISYNELIAYANREIPDPEERESYIVHTASGVFNKAFYLLSQKIGIRKAYHAMALANIKYWNSNTDFKSGACGVLHAAYELQLDTNPVITAFNQVGVETSHC